MSGASGLRKHGHTSAGDGGTITGSAPTTADYLVGTTQGGLSAEIVVGTTPGGELGGSWASPTIDATHSGSAHHAESHAARHKDAGADSIKLNEFADPMADVDLAGQKLINVDDPASAQDAATKAYVDGLIGGSLTYLDHGNTGSTETVDVSAADVHRLVANAATVTLTLTGWPTSGVVAKAELWLEQDGTGGRDWVFPGSVTFGSVGEPDWTTRAGGDVDVVDLMTVDGGTTVVASLAGREGPPGSAGVAEDLTTAETDTSLVLAPDGAGGVEFRAESGGAATASEAFLTSDQTISTPGTFVDGPSLSLVAGTYVIWGHVCLDQSAAQHMTARLWDGSTVWDSPEARNFGSGTEIMLEVMAGPIVLGSTTTVKISATCGPTTTGHILATGGQAGTTNKASHIVALKIA